MHKHPLRIKHLAQKSTQNQRGFSLVHPPAPPCGMARAAIPKYTSGMKIHIFADVACPWCFIGKRRLERALAELGASDPRNPWTITWQPFQMNPDMPPEGMERGSYLTLKFGSFERAKRIENEIAKIGGREGIVFAFDGIDRTPNTLVPHRLLRAAHATGSQGQVIESLFCHYFVGGNDIGSIEVLSDIAAEAGMDRAENPLAVGERRQRCG